MSEKRADKIVRYKQSGASSILVFQDDPLQEYMNIAGMIFSLVGLMMKIKWCAWIAVICSIVSFANTRNSEDTKQVLSCFMLSISAVVMSYLQSPLPMTLPFIS